MDGLDVRILRAMGIRPFRSTPGHPDALKTGRIAKQVGVTDDTVRARLSRMEDEGVIAGYQAAPNLAHLDLSASAFLFVVARDRDKDEVLAKARSVEGLLEVHDFIGPGLCLDIAFRGDDERARKLEGIAALTGDPDPRTFYHRRTPAVDRPLSELDWRIVQALRWDARRSVADVAEDVGVTGRTVKRRRDRMVREGSLLLVPLFDPSRADGLILFDLLVQLDGEPTPRIKGALLETFDEHCVHALKPVARSIAGLNLVLCAKSSREVDALQRRALELEGVRGVHVALFRRVEDTSRWLDDEIARRAGMPTHGRARTGAGSGASTGAKPGQVAPNVQNAESRSAGR